MIKKIVILGLLMMSEVICANSNDSEEKSVLERKALKNTSEESSQTISFAEREECVDAAEAPYHSWAGSWWSWHRRRSVSGLFAATHLRSLREKLLEESDRSVFFNLLEEYRVALAETAGGHGITDIVFDEPLVRRRGFNVIEEPIRVVPRTVRAEGVRVFGGGGGRRRGGGRGRRR